MTGNRSVFVAEHKDINLIDNSPNCHVITTNNTDIRLGWTLLRNESPPLVTWLHIQQITDSLSVWQIFNVQVNYPTLSWSICKDIQFNQSIFTDWRIQLNSQVIEIKPNSISLQNYQYTITGLEDCKYYEGFIMWNNTTKSPHFNFTTQLEDFKVLSLTGKTTDNFIDLSWTIPKCNYSSVGAGAYLKLFLNDTFMRNVSFQDHSTQINGLESNTVYKVDLQSCDQDGICTSTERVLKTTFDNLREMYVDILMVKSTATNMFTNCSIITGTVDEFYYSLRDEKGKIFKSITAGQCLFEHICSESDESHLNVYVSAGVRRANGSMIKTQESQWNYVNECRINSLLNALIIVIVILVLICIIVIFIKLYRRRTRRQTRITKEIRVILPAELNLFNDNENYAHDNETTKIELQTTGQIHQ